MVIQLGKEIDNDGMITLQMGFLSRNIHVSFWINIQYKQYFKIQLQTHTLSF